MRRFLFLLSFLWYLVAITSAFADIILLDGVVKSIDAKKRTITVKSGSEERTLDVSSKAKIVIEKKRQDSIHWRRVKMSHCHITTNLKSS